MQAFLTKLGVQCPCCARPQDEEEPPHSLKNIEKDLLEAITPRPGFDNEQTHSSVPLHQQGECNTLLLRRATHHHVWPQAPYHVSDDLQDYGKQKRAQSAPPLLQRRFAAAKTPKHSEAKHIQEIEEMPAKGESWPAFVQRSGRRLKKDNIQEDASTLFETFRTSADLEIIFATFARLFHAATWVTHGHSDKPQRRGSGVGHQDTSAAPWLGPAEVEGRLFHFPYEPIRLLLGGNWKAKGLWKKLDDRIGRSEYTKFPCSKGRLANKRVVIIGAGPCGLRAAIELRMLGARVTVVDRRVNFTRINQLHLWSWCGEEIKELGARHLEPPPTDFGTNPDVLHIGIADLQKLLLKVALLLGTEVLLGTDFIKPSWTDGVCNVQLGSAFSAGGPLTEGRDGEVGQGPQAQVSWPSPTAPDQLPHVGVLVAANGFGSSVGTSSGMHVTQTESLRRESAIGLICNFQRMNGPSERLLRPFKMARQYYMPLFAKVAKETGAELENIVYIKGHLSHYFVMTPTHRSLVEAGVLPEGSSPYCLDANNVNQSKLDAYARKVASYKFKGEMPTVMEAATRDALIAVGADIAAGTNPVGYQDRGPRLFDFSTMRRQSCALTFLKPDGWLCADIQEDAKTADANHELDSENVLLVAAVGDALMEPFWPEGLGIIRGFFSVLDVSASIKKWAGGASSDEVHKFSDEAYLHLKTLGAATRAKVLWQDERKYALAPSSRYRQFAGETDCPVVGACSIAQKASFIMRAESDEENEEDQELPNNANQNLSQSWFW